MSTLLKVATLVLATAFSLACRKLDLSQPIALVPDGTVFPNQERALAEAARCWNLGFGVDLRVTREPHDTEQQVEFFIDDQVCLHAQGQYVIGTPRAVTICSANASTFETFWIGAHELGHVVNIYGHPSERDALMGKRQPQPDEAVFTDVDRRLFVEANPNVAVAAQCDPIYIDRNGDFSSPDPSCACP